MKRIFLFLLMTLISNLLFAQQVKKVSSQKAFAVFQHHDKKSSVIIDGRTAEMYDAGHIKNAININAFDEDVARELDRHTDKKQLVVYCTMQNRSKTLIKKLKELNYSGEIVFITDGIKGWKKNGYELNTKLQNKQKASTAEQSKPFEKLRPIVQIFGTGAYDVGNKHYGYSFGRAHLGFKYQFNERWTGKIIIDRGRPTTVNDITITDADGNKLEVTNTASEGSYYTMWLKFARLKWQVNDRLSLIGGALLQNHYITQERFWGFRYVAQTFQDMYWHIPSTDLGFRADYKLNDVFSLDAALTNGEGPRMKQDAFGNVKYATGLDINPGNKFQSRIYYHNRATGIDSLSAEQMFSVFMGHKFNDKFRFGGEFNYMKNLNNGTETDSYGFSVYSAYEVIDNTQFFIRYDRLLYEVSNNSDGNAIIGGVSYSPAKGINFSLNYQAWMPDEGNIDPENNVMFSMEYKF